MTESADHRTCEALTGTLVDYVDGELPPAERAVVERHLAGCQTCRATVTDLRRSLAAAERLWQDAEAQLAAVRMPSRRPTRLPWARAAGLVAGLLVLVSALLAWQWLGRSNAPGPMAQGPPNMAPPLSGDGDLTFAQLQERIEAAGDSARLLAATDHLAGQPGAEEVVRRQYAFIVEMYGDTNAGKTARARLATLSTRSTLQ